MKNFAALMVLMMAGSFAAVAQDDRDAAVAAVNNLFDAMKAKNGEQIKSVFSADAHFLAIDKPRDGKGISKTRLMTGEEFAKMISEAKGPDYNEKMISPEARISGDLAIVSGRYTFYLADKFSHYGTDTFNLVRTDAGWKIVQGAFTLEFQCDRDLKAVSVPKITADPKDVSTLDGIVKAFYETITGPKGAPRQWGRDRTLYMAGVNFVGMNEAGGKIRPGIMNHQQYVNATNESFVSEGFTEKEISRTFTRFGNIAHVFSTYEFTNDAKTEKGRGVNSIELFWDGTRWWISFAAWDEERPNNLLPAAFLPKGGNKQ